MTFGSKVDNVINIVISKNLGDGFSITDISLIEFITWIIFNAFKVFEITRVGQFVKTDYAVVGVFAEHMEYEIAADAFDEMLDSEEYDELVDADEE